jgi:hypothetical protein
MLTERTQEDVAQSVAAAYDSLALITELKAKPTLTSDEADMLSRNEIHVRAMLKQGWFTSALTQGQKLELEAI